MRKEDACVGLTFSFLTFPVRGGALCVRAGGLVLQSAEESGGDLAPSQLGRTIHTCDCVRQVSSPDGMIVEAVVVDTTDSVL